MVIFDVIQFVFKVEEFFNFPVNVFQDIEEVHTQGQDVKLSEIPYQVLATIPTIDYDNQARVKRSVEEPIQSGTYVDLDPFTVIN